MTSREPQHGWVDTGEVKLHYWDWPGGEPAMLCIHGLTANGRSWDLLADQLGSRHRIIAVDVRGRGLSGKPPEGQYGFAAHAGDIAALLRALDTGPVIVAGHSMGAFVAILLAGDHPELVSHVILIDGGAVGEGLSEEDLRVQGQAAMQRLTTVYPSMSAYYDFWRQSAPFIPWTKYFERYLQADVEERSDGSVVCRSFPPGIVQDLREVATWDVKGRAPRVKVPALALWAPVGLQDPARPLFPRPVMEQLTSLLPEGRLVPIEGANHYTIGFSPGCVSKVVAAFEEFLYPRA